MKVFHAYLLEGERTAQNAELERLCLQILCKKNPPCKGCNACRKYLTGNHPDVKILCGEANVKEVRQFLCDLWLTSSDGGAKIYIIENADSLAEYSQNALLLPIEEPPSDVYFILLCRSSEKILQTVKSRCRHIFLGDGENIEEEKEALCKSFLESLFQKDAASSLSLLTFKKEERGAFSEFVKYLSGYCRRKIKQLAGQNQIDETAVYLSLLSVGEKWSVRSEMNLNITLAFAGFVFDCYNAVSFEN